MEMPQAKSQLQRTLEESRKKPDPDEEYYSSIERLVGSPRTFKSSPRAPYEVIPFTQDTAPTSPERLTPGGFAENILKDGFDFAKGIFDAVLFSWPRAIKSGYQLINTPGAIDYLIKNPSLVADATWNTAKIVANAVAEPYREHPTTFWYHRPVGTFADALFLLTGGGSSIAKAGRLSGSTRLEALGRAMAETPGRMLRSVEDAAIKHIGRQDPDRWRLALALKGEEKGAVPAKVMADMEQAGNYVKSLSDGDAQLFHRFRTQGASAAELAASPKVAEALEKYRALADTWKAELKARGLLDDATADTVLQKKYAAEVFGEINKDTMAAAKAAIEGAEVKPIYSPSYVEKPGAVDITDFLSQPSVMRTGKAGMLEQYKGAKGAITDPRVYVPRAIEAFRKVEANLRFIERALQEPTLLVPAKTGTAEKAVQIQERGVFSKYFEDQARAKAVFIRDVIKEHGIDKASEMVLGNKAMRKELYQISTIVGDSTVRRIIAMEFSKAGGPLGIFLRAYDRLLNLFKASATTLNPKWYTGNVVGDGILSVIAGVTAGDWKMARRLLDSMPLHLRKGMGGLAREAGQIDKLQSFTEFVQGVDNATRSGIITRELGAKFKAAGQSFYATEQALRPIISAPFNLSEAQVRTQLLQEQIARSVPSIRKLDKALERLNELKVNAEADIAARGQRFQTNLQLEATKRLDDLAKRIATNSERATLLRADDARYVELTARSREIAAELEWMKGKHPKGAEDRLRAQELRTEKAMADRDAAKLKDAVDKKRAMREENVKLKQQLASEKRTIEGRREGIATSVQGRTAQEQTNAAAIQKLDAKIATIQSQRSAAVADYRATWQKMSAASANTPELQKMTAQFREAERVANAFVGNYNAMDPLEQSVFRRIVPFHTWSKAMTLLAFRLPFLRPGTAFMWDKLAAAMGSMAGDDELPEWLAGYFPVFARQNGDTVWARLTGFNPASGVKTSSIGDVAVPNLFAFWEANPFIATGYKLVGGKTVFDRGTIPYGEPLVSLGNGDVYEFSEDGKLRETIPQAPLISTLAHMFPSTQLVEQLIQPYAVAEGNIPIVWPKPVLNPDGSIKYPREMWEMLISPFIRTSVKNPEAAKEQERRKVRQAVLTLRSLYQRSDPETKKLIEERLTEYANGRYRRIGR